MPGFSKKEKLSEQETVRKEDLSRQMMEYRLSIGLGEHELQDYIKPWVKRNGQCLQSQPVQKEASRVWSGVKKVLFGNGKKLHFKKNRDFRLSAANPVKTVSVLTGKK